MTVATPGARTVTSMRSRRAPGRIEALTSGVVRTARVDGSAVVTGV